jgi:hypothetical protein
MNKFITEKDVVIEVLKRLEKSNYVDPAEHLYDAIKNIKKHLDDENIEHHIRDFLWGLESMTVLDVDGVVKECSNLMRNFREKNINTITWIKLREGEYETYPKEGIDVLVTDGIHLDIAWFLMSSTYEWRKTDLAIDDAKLFNQFKITQWAYIN